MWRHSEAGAVCARHRDTLGQHLDVIQPLEPLQHSSRGAPHPEIAQAISAVQPPLMHQGCRSLYTGGRQSIARSRRKRPARAASRIHSHMELCATANEEEPIAMHGPQTVRNFCKVAGLIHMSCRTDI